MPNGTHLIFIEDWKCRLGISNWQITCELIDEMQVTDIWFESTSGHEFVGIAIYKELRSGIIYHTRDLNEDDIIHELLHVRYPNWSEDKVEFWTDLLMGRPISLDEDSSFEHLLPTG